MSYTLLLKLVQCPTVLPYFQILKQHSGDVEELLPGQSTRGPALQNTDHHGAHTIKTEHVGHCGTATLIRLLPDRTTGTGLGQSALISEENRGEDVSYLGESPAAAGVEVGVTNANRAMSGRGPGTFFKQNRDTSSHALEKNTKFSVQEIPEGFQGPHVLLLNKHALPPQFCQ